MLGALHTPAAREKTKVKVGGNAKRCAKLRLDFVDVECAREFC
jgi:hypothetical protein